MLSGSGAWLMLRRATQGRKADDGRRKTSWVKGVTVRGQGCCCLRLTAARWLVAPLSPTRITIFVQHNSNLILF